MVCGGELSNMKLGTRCTTCGERIDAADIVTCDVCGRDQHGPCREYETNFECRRCGDETWIDAVEF